MAADRSRPHRRLARATTRYLLLGVAAVVVGFPIYMTLVTALLSPSQTAARPPYLFPTDPQWQNFASAWTDGHLGLYMRNSVIVTVCITAAQLVTSVLGGYAFAFLYFPFRRFLFGLCVATLMIPLEVTIIPNRATIASLGWLNSFPALIVPFVASGLGVFLFRQAFLSFPSEIRDAATLDGQGHVRFMFSVLLPINRALIGAFCVFAFLSSWNQYLWPLVVTETDSVRTVQIGLHQLQSVSSNQTNILVAGTVLAALPIFVILFAFQKQLVRGITVGAVKG
jgi:sn-glycerol 3-phosphate transport system permease protein